MTDVDTEQRRLAAFHEAGHAIAAVSRGGSSLRSVNLGTTHGEGLTLFRAKGFDAGFIAYAGPWAEARTQWGDEPKEDLNEEGVSFSDYVMGVILSQPDDASIIAAAERAFQSMLEGSGEARALTIARSEHWGWELERAWQAIDALAAVLLSGASINDQIVRTLLEASHE